MPFFQMSTPGQIRNYCENQSLENLLALNRRFGSFFKKISEREEQNLQKLALIAEQIDGIPAQLKANSAAMESIAQRNRDILDNLPENAAERYLALQQVNYNFTDLSFDLERQLKQLNKEKNELNSHNAWIRTEVSACVQELKIVNAVIEEKKLALMPQQQAEPLHRV